ncbi:MAG: hypothetical protein KME06_10965 [Kastovskya adunca ATA6-11-RM4]|nr:hypothetical protein [Kastovskya adunca ATA6-11-RM4]
MSVLNHDDDNCIRNPVVLVRDRIAPTPNNYCIPLQITAQQIKKYLLNK